LGLSTTPTVEVAVTVKKGRWNYPYFAQPKQWNALKLLNEKGVLKWKEGLKILEIAEAEAFDFSDVDDLESIMINDAHGHSY
jgi:phosphomannomutase